MEEPINYQRLYEQYLEGRITSEEYTALLLHFHRRGQATGLRESIEETLATPPPALWENQDHVQETFQRVAANLRQTIYQDNDISLRQRTGRRRFMYLLPYAAAVIAALATGFFFWGDGTFRGNQPPIVTEIPPGGNRATLTLADGTTIDLSAEQTGIVIRDQHITYADGTSIINSSANTDMPVEVSELVLSTPKGGTYQVTLPDGSNVWLNANSTLTYPSRFPGASREVTLQGEAYFEIAHKELAPTLVKDGQGPLVPFLVKTPTQTVEVLGTEFNISAYADDPDTKTTLLKGKVKVLASDQHNRYATLLPGQQATIRGSAITVGDVDVQQYTAWKDGFFYFDGMAPQSALSQLSRWYDIEVVYKGKMPSVRFFGMLDKSGRLSDILSILKESGLEFNLVKSGDSHQLVIFGE